MKRTTTSLRVLSTCVCLLMAVPGLNAQSMRRHQPIPLQGPRNTAVSKVQTNYGSGWTPIVAQAPFIQGGAANPLLLTDGTVLVQDYGWSDWWKLTPDIHGSYANGTWTQVASLPPGYAPLAYASAVLPDGRVIVEGGEYNFYNLVFTSLGAIYDPVADQWASVAPPPFFQTCCGGAGIGDAQSVVLANGVFMLANSSGFESALLDPKTLTWTQTGANKFDPMDEEGWTLLPNGHVLTVDTDVCMFGFDFPCDPTITNSEVYVPGSGEWHSAGSTVVQLWDSGATCGGINSASFEIGPAVLRPDGTVFATGANTCGGGQSGHTAIYNSDEGTWSAGPDFPANLSIADGPAALEPNGKVLMIASPGFNQPPSTFLEWDGKNLTTVAGPPNAAVDASSKGTMLVLPTGQILLTDGSEDIELYTPSGTYHPSWAPRIHKAPKTVSPGGSYVLTGHLLNGMSQGAMYGDDAQGATNYPLVRITNRATGHVFYSRTHDHSTMAVAFDGLSSTHFDVPAAQEQGLSDLVVVANGIPSRPITIDVQ